MEATHTQIPVFRRGAWHVVPLPFSDPGLTEGQLRFAAAVAGGPVARGVAVAEAVAVAEGAMYEQVYHGLRVPRKEHGTPKH